MTVVLPGCTDSVIVRPADTEAVGQAPTTVRLPADGPQPRHANSAEIS